ncbi:hypothetical protein, partial [Salmonella enterica]|uniref:hypothetical protein n=1 Tax=Salmonella enterica TaxID=28901 RepID=UPI000AFB9A5C
MSSVPYHSNNSVMPVRVTIYEAVNIIKKQANEEITASEIWRYALYGHPTLSIYFQSPVIFRRIKTRKNKIFLMKGKDDPGFAPIFPDICYHLTHYKPAAADIPVASDNPAHYADAIRYNAR